jgi:hypothetical protein
MFLRTLSRLVLVAALVAGAGAVPARPESAERTPRSFSSLINVDALVDNYLRFVSRKYNLTEEQDAYTEQLVRARVDEFLNRHYDELADLVDKLVTVRNGGEVAPEELIEWGRRIQPIYQEAKGIIIQTNEDWRGILNEEQRRMHDEDVKLMYESFATTEDQLSRLTAGQMSVEEFRNPRLARQTRPQTVAAQPSTGTVVPTEQVGSAARQMKGMSRADQFASPKRPVARARGSATGQGRQVGGPAGGNMYAGPDASAPAARRSGHQRVTSATGGSSTADQWEQYVQQFIERYKLNEEQASRAHKILKSCQNQRERYLRGRAEQLEKLDRQEAKEQADITAQRTKLMAPIDNIFERQLKPRLEKIPTRAQREAAGKAGPAEKASAARSVAGKTPPPAAAPPGKSQPAVQPQGDPPTLEGTPDNPDQGEEDDEGEGDK